MGKEKGQRLDDPGYEPEGVLTEPDVEPEPDQEPGKAPGEPLSPEPGSPSTEGDDQEIPDEYFGVKLSEIPDEAARKQVFETLQQANKVTNARFQELAELRKQAEEEARKVLPERQAPGDEPTERTPEELLVAAGLDPELLRYDEIGKPVVALLERLMGLEEQLQGVTQQTESQAWEAKFFGKLEGLESKFGEIPYEREDVEAFAIERNIYDPDALYWAIMGPVLREAAVDRVPQNNAVRDLKRQVGSGNRKRSSAPGSTQGGKPTTLQEAYEAAKTHHNVPAGHDPFAYDE